MKIEQRDRERWSDSEQHTLPCFWYFVILDLEEEPGVWGPGPGPGP